MTVSPRTPECIEIVADHGGYELKHHLVKKLREAGYDVIDFGNHLLTPDDDYPDVVENTLRKDRPVITPCK